MAEKFRPQPAANPAPAEIAAWVGGELIEPQLAPKRITGLATLEDATADDLAFVASDKYLKAAKACPARVMLAPKGFPLEGRARIEVGFVWGAVVTVINKLYPQPLPPPGVHPSAVIEDGAKIAADASIGPFCRIGARAEIGAGAIIGPGCSIDPDCRVGEGTRLHSNVSLQGLVQIGRRCILHSGAVLGADGFRFEMGPAGLLKIPQVGAIIIEDEVEIGANTTIDRPFMTETRIGWGTKLDNQVHIAHNCQIGKMCVIAACTGIAGSTVVEDACMFGGQIAIADNLHLARGTKVASMSGVMKDSKPGEVLCGVPARPIQENWKMLAHLARIGKLVDRVKALETARDEMAKG